ADTRVFGSTRYFYRVAALDATGRSVPSAVATIISGPAAPFAVTVSSISASSLLIDWRDVSGDTGYRVERSLDGVHFSPVRTVGKNVISYCDKGPLLPGTTYTYRVFALSPYGDSPASATASGATRKSDVLPAPWDDQDVGAVTAAGWATYDPTAASFSVNAG